MNAPILAEPATILVVDDTPGNLDLMAALLQDRYRVKVAINGEKAMRIARSDSPPDLILLDIMMPGISGYQVCEELKRDPATKAIPIIFLTAMAATEDEARGLELGAVDFITKPVNPPIMLARVAGQLQLKAAADFLRDQNSFLEAEVQRRSRDLIAIQDVTIEMMAGLAETRDSETGNHIRRTQHYMKALAEQLRTHPRYGSQLDDPMVDLLFRSAPLHDIGKVGIPDRILLKPGRLTPEEFAIMQTHTTLGRDAIAMAERQLGMEVAFLRVAKEIACSHHEKWDGNGYPEGLVGEAIPLSARLMAVADVYDSLISHRVYKRRMSHEEAVAIIEAGKGHHFDPVIVEAFRAVDGEIRAIAELFADSDADLRRKDDSVRMMTG